MNITTEQTFETAIVEHLVEHGGYTQGNAEDYSPELGLFKYEVIHFLRTSQPHQWQKLEEIHGEACHERVMQRLCKELDLRGSLDVLRNGFVDYGVRLADGLFQARIRLKS